MSRPKHRYHVRRVAYELWCLQEDRRDAHQPVGGLDALIFELRQRHPQLDQAVVDQAAELFLNRMFEESIVQITQHREWILRWALPSARVQSGRSCRDSGGWVLRDADAAGYPVSGHVTQEV